MNKGLGWRPEGGGPAALGALAGNFADCDLRDWGRGQPPGPQRRLRSSGAAGACLLLPAAGAPAAAADGSARTRSLPDPPCRWRSCGFAAPAYPAVPVPGAEAARSVLPLL